VTHEDSDKETNLSAIGSLYRGLVAHWIHQDRLLWGRTQLVIAVESAVLVISYNVFARSPWLSGIVFIFGIVVLLGIFQIIRLDQKDRDLVLPLIRWTGKKLVGVDEGTLISEGVLNEGQTLDEALGMYSPPQIFTGDRIIKGFAIFFLVTNVVLLFLLIIERLPYFE